MLLNSLEHLVGRDPDLGGGVLVDELPHPAVDFLEALALDGGREVLGEVCLQPLRPGKHFLALFVRFRAVADTLNKLYADRLDENGNWEESSGLKNINKTYKIEDI